MKIFIDTNIFFIHLTQAEQWKEMEAIFEANDLFTSTIVLNELRYKLLWQAAADALGTMKKYDIQKRIKKDASLRKQVYARYLEFYFSLKKDCTILPLVDDEAASCALSQQHHLLPADADILATMRREGITAILTTDDDFKGIPGIKVLGL
jgi:predicted nucleic acid-binding protein